MESPKRKRRKLFRLDNSPKVLRLDIELLPNEILVKIFSCLKIKELYKCGHVSKKFRQISHDKSFWKCVNLYNQRVSCQFVVQILQLGTEYLNLYGAILLDGGDKDILPKNNLKYLNLAFSSVKDKFLVKLLRSSVCLEKISLREVNQKQIRFRNFAHEKNHQLEVKLQRSMYIECLLPNTKMITTLDLSNNKGNMYKLNSKSMKEILLNCVELKEANFEGQIFDVEFFANNLTPKIEKLNISHNKGFIYEPILSLVKHCKKITELDLDGCDLDIDRFDTDLEYGAGEFQNCLIAISKYLSQSLVKLQLPDHSILYHEFLKSLPKLQNIGINNEDATSIMKEYPLIVLNKGPRSKIAYSTNEYFVPRQGFWEIKCATIDFSKPPIRKMCYRSS